MLFERDAQERVMPYDSGDFSLHEPSLIDNSITRRNYHSSLNTSLSSLELIGTTMLVAGTTLLAPLVGMLAVAYDFYNSLREGDHSQF